jgi:putative spermidine/putrescine transport system permease protein
MRLRRAALAPYSAEADATSAAAQPRRATPPVWASVLFVAPLLLFLTIVYIVPFLGVAAWSVTMPTPGLGQYQRLVGDPLVLSVFLRTFRVCLSVTALSVAAAYAITYVWVRAARWQRRLAELCILIPFWISVLTRAFGWLAVLSNRGLINAWLQAAGLIESPLSLSRNEAAVVVGMTHMLIPFAAFPLASAMRAVDERVLLAARGLGASRLRIFWQVFLPMTRSGVIGAALIVFVFSLGFFVTPAILGGGRSIMASELVYLRMFQSPDWGLGAAISVTLVGIVGLALAGLYSFAAPALLGGRR